MYFLIVFVEKQRGDYHFTYNGDVGGDDLEIICKMAIGQEQNRQ